jgi:dUTP pyrophosphatase
MLKSILIEFVKLHKNAIVPTKAYPDDSCYDLYAVKTIELKPLKPTIVPCGISLDIPKGYEMLPRGRSGLALNDQIIVFPSTIDSGYRGDVGPILINLKDVPHQIRQGQRFSQFCIKPIYKLDFIEVKELPQTVRGNRGYGSSGE